MSARKPTHRWAAAGLACGLAMPAAAQLAMEPGNWRIKTISTTNGVADAPQDQEECLRDELKDLSGYFAPQLEGVKAKCTRTPQRSGADTVAYKMKCTGAGFTMNAESAVKFEDPKRFTASMKLDTKTTTEHAVVVAKVEGVHTGPCKGK